MKKFRMLLALVLIMAFLFPLMSYAESMPVIGKLYIKPGAEVVLMTSDENIFIAIAAEEQVFYINYVLSAKDDTLLYIGDATGFVHLCEKHGRESLNLPLIFAVSNKLFDKNGYGIGRYPARIELF